MQNDGNGISLDYTLAAINFDNSIDVFDITLLVDIILHRFEPTALQRYVADIRQDGNINVLDVLTLVSTVINN